jgi:cyclopropane fatty-acyl-phospholipid synthase-like methyltransferase
MTTLHSALKHVEGATLPVEHKIGGLHLEHQPAHTHMLRAIFGDSWVGQERFTPTAELDALYTAIEARPGAAVLDLWCGTGGPAIYLARQTGCRVVGIDPSVDNIRRARATAAAAGVADQVQFFACALSTAPFPAGSFDAIIGCDAFFPIVNKLRLFSNCWRLLRPGGRMACTAIVDYGDMASRLERTTQLTWNLSTARVRSADRSEHPDTSLDIVQPLLTANDYCAVATLAGLQVVAAEDLTASLRVMGTRWSAALQLWEEALIAEQGRAPFDRLHATIGRLAEWATQDLIGQVRLVALHPSDGAHPAPGSIYQEQS